MATAQPIKEQLLREIEKLPEDQMGEVLDFVEFLMAKQRRGSVTHSSPTATNDEGDDPMAAFIGGVSHGSLAQNIDQELYGS